ncbi:MAG: Flp family type IVb pilin [Sphingomonadaceae bacterium]
MLRLGRALARDKRGATAIEYGLIVSLIVVAIIASMNTVASNTIRMWNSVSNSVAKSSQ